MRTVCIVDDDPTNMNLLQMLLELDGYETLACANLDEAKKAANHVSAFVVDCHLAKGASGLDLLTQIRAGETAVSPATIVIMVSGDSRLEQPSLNAGANAFLHKPYSPNKLIETLQTHLSQ